MYSVNGAQVLNITLLFILSFCLALCICSLVLAAGVPASPVISIVPFTSIYVTGVICYHLSFIFYQSSFIFTHFVFLNLDD